MVEEHGDSQAATEHWAQRARRALSRGEVELGPVLSRDALIVRRIATHEDRPVEIRSLGVEARLRAGALPDAELDVGRAARRDERWSLTAQGWIDDATDPAVLGVPQPDRVAATPSPSRPREALATVLVLARALADGHARGLAHGAVRPSAIAIGPGGPRLDDWVIGAALARVVQKDSAVLEEMARFASPELAGGGGATPSSDVFSWGSTTYELVTGEPAFEGETLIDQLMSVAAARVRPSPAMDDFDPRLAPLVARALRRDPKARPSAEELVEALEEILEIAAPEEVQAHAPRLDLDLMAELQGDPLDGMTEVQTELPNHVEAAASRGAAFDAVPRVAPVDAVPMVAPPPRDESGRTQVRSAQVSSTQTDAERDFALPATAVLAPQPAPRRAPAERRAPEVAPRDRADPRLVWAAIAIAALTVLVFTTLLGMWAAS